MYYLLLLLGVMFKHLFGKMITTSLSPFDTKVNTLVFFLFTGNSILFNFATSYRCDP